MNSSRIIDPRTGEPFKLKNISNEPQTAHVSSLHNEFSDHPTLGLTPPKVASILRDAEQGDMIAQNDLYEDMEEKDAHVFAEMQKRKMAIVGLEWDIVPPRDASAQEKRAADLAREIVQDMENLDDVIMDMATAIGHAYSCQEIEWQRLGKEWLPASIDLRPHRWFTLDQETRTQLRLRNVSVNGEALRPFNWIVHRHKARSGYLSRAGLVRVLAWPFLFKNYSVRDLAEFLEIYGLPLRVGTYPAGANDTEKATLMRAVVNIGHAAAGIIPEGMMIDFKEAAKGASDPYMAMIEWAERSQSKAILGGTLTSGTGEGTNTNALGNVHNEVRRDLTVADAKQFAGTITRDLIFPLVALNVGGIDSLRRCPRFKFETEEEEDMNARAERDKKIYDLGYRPTEEYIKETYGDGFEKIPENGPVPLKAGAAALRAGTGDPDVVDLQLERLQGEAGVDEMMQAVQQLLGEVATLDEFRDRLLEAVPDMSQEKLSELFASAMIAAELAGRYDILSEAEM